MAARLSDPALMRTEAFKIGGFDVDHLKNDINGGCDSHNTNYNDDDACSQNGGSSGRNQKIVTLSQRKSQLGWRICLAKQQMDQD